MKFYCGSNEEYEAMFGNGPGLIPLHFYEPRWYTCSTMTEEEYQRYLDSVKSYGATVPLWVATDTTLFYEPPTARYIDDDVPDEVELEADGFIILDDLPVFEGEWEEIEVSNAE